MVVFIVAMEDEITEILEDPNCEVIEDNVFYKYCLFNDKGILITGITKIKAAAALSSFLKVYNYPDLTLVNLGVAGFFAQNKQNLKKVYAINLSYFHDVDVTKFGYKKGQIPKEKITHMSLTNTFKHHIKTIINKPITNNPCFSGDKFIESPKDIDPYFTKKHSEYLVDMELAALAFVARKANVKIESYKWVSDCINSQDNSQEYIQTITSIAQEISRVIKEL